MSVSPHMIWWNNLSSLEQEEIEIENGIHGHDEGTTESEIEHFHREFIRTDKSTIRNNKLELLLT
jgi:hypothetical protein